MTVTLIIPTRNRLRCLRRVLPTYYGQEGLSGVLLVDDAGEPPLSAADLPAPPDSLELRVERLPHRHGQPAARNHAARIAPGEWLFYSDDDVFLEPDYLACLLRAQQETGAAIVAGRRIMLADGENVQAARARCEASTRPLFDPRRMDADFQAPVQGNREVLHLQTTALIRADVAREIQWDPGYRPPSYREETDFYVRAAKAGHRLVLCGDAVCYHLSPADTATGGQRARHWWQYEWGVVVCNHRFLSRHYPFLRERGAIEGPRWLAELRFADWRLRGGLLRALYPRYYRSGLRRTIHRLRGAPDEA